MKYYKLAKDNHELYVKVKKEHSQENTAGILLEVVDWSGDWKKVAYQSLNFNNKDKLLLVGYNAYSLRKKISEKEFNLALDRELHQYKEQLASKEPFNIYFKRTQERMERLKKYCK